MPSTPDILKFSLSEKFLYQVMVSHRNVVAISSSYKECGTLQEGLVIKKDIYSANAPHTQPPEDLERQK